MSTLADRKNRIVRQMQASGVDRLVLGAGGRHMIDEADPITHLTGFLAIGPALLLLDSGGQVTLVTAPSGDAERLQARVTDAKCMATDCLIEVFTEELQQTRGRVAGVGLEALPFVLYGQLCGALGGVPRGFDEEFYAVSGAKTDQELASARLGTEIAEKAYERLFAVARPGMRECDLGSELNVYMKSLGANDSFFMLNAGKNVPGVMPSSERPIEIGDQLLVELSPSCEGQFVQICRTVCVGEPSEDLQTKYALLCRACQNGIAQVRPGVKLSDVCDGVDAVMAEAGFAEYSRPPYLKRRGHGLSCGSMSPGDVAFDNPIVLEQDMLFMVHPNQFLPGPGYMMCGEPVRVTADGVEVLSKVENRLGVLEA